jgi:GR25 family glycosyltransferase involved in LPS biosynthesis
MSEDIEKNSAIKAQIFAHKTMFDFVLPIMLATAPATVPEQIVAPQVADWNCPLRTIAKRHIATMSSKELDDDWRLNEFFGSVFVINLPQAHERLEMVSRDLHAIGAEFELFTAVDGRKDLEPAIWKKLIENRGYNLFIPQGRQKQLLARQGAAGCYMSHFRLIHHVKHCRDHAISMLKQAQAANDTQAIQQAKRDLHKYSRVLILEDDCGFGIVSADKTSATRKGVGLKWRQALQSLPDDWDMLYLMAQAQQPTTQTSQHLRKLKETSHTLAYAINYTMYGPILNQLKKIENPAIKSIEPVDHAISAIHHLHKVYAVYPSIAFQQAGHSFISGGHPKLHQPQPVK